MTLRIKLLSYTFCVILMVGGAISLYAIAQGRHYVLTTFQGECHDTAAMMAELVANDVYVLNLLSLRNRLANMRINPTIRYTYIMDADGVVLADGTQANILRDQRLPAALGADLLQREVWLSRIDAGGLTVGGPLWLSDGHRIGSLVVGFSLDRVNRLVHEATHASLYLTLTCLGIGACLAFWVSTRVSRPIAAMVHAARAIGAGDLTTRVHLQRRDELGRLAEAINGMAAGLEQGQAMLHGKIAETQALYEIGQEITAQVVLGPTLQLIVERACSLLQAERCLLALRRGEGQSFAFQASSGTLTEELARLHFRPGEGLSGHVVLTAAPQVVDDYLQDYRESPFLATAAMAGIRSAVAVPLRARGTIIGVLMVTSRVPHQFGSDDQQRLSALADQAAIAIENAQLYEAVRQHAAVLAAEVETRTRELQASNARLKELDRLKSEFVSDVSHELRTPLTSIKGYIDYLLEGIVGELSPPQHDFLTRVQGNIDRLVRLITNLLDLARIEAGQVDTHLVTFAMAEVATEVLETLRPLAVDKGVALGLDIPERGGLVRADRDHLAQVLLNLLHNAVKFTPIGGKVRVRIEARPPGEVLTVVQDTGEGIPAEELARIFDQFYQVNPASAPTRGSGLGLTIAKKLVELYGGHLWVTSQLGQGSTFGFTLPAVGMEANG